MKKRSLIIAAGVICLAFGGCGTNQSSVDSTEVKKAEGTGTAVSESAGQEELNYTFGESFFSEEPVSYTMFWSDHEAYPIKDSWEIFSEIEKRTNVKLDYKDYMIARTDYDNKKALMINAGQSAYIIPKTYDENAFVDGGAVVAVSDWVQYMPNYTAFIEKYNLQEDIEPLIKSDGKYYRLPGLHENANQDYTFVIRNDIFKAAGVDVAELEKNWTWQDLYDALVQVKAYMVSEGMCSESNYVWADRWPGDDGSGGNLPKLMGASYDVSSGWGIGNGLRYDREKDEWFFSPTTDNAKAYMMMMNQFVSGGILDPETFTQTDEQACQKFYRGETVIMGVNKASYNDYVMNLNSTLGEGNYELYIMVSPAGTNNYKAETTRLENGVMVAAKALDELGEADFIKMMRFIDWLFYSDEAKDLVKWGVEGQTYEVVKDENEKEVKQLLPEWYCGALSIPKTSENQKDMRIELGYAGGVFSYGGTTEQYSDALIPELRDYFMRVGEYKENRGNNPAVPATEDENEQLNLWRTPLVDNVNSWTLQFVTGQRDIETQWDTYVESCKQLNSEQLTALTNEIHLRAKQ